MKPHELSVAIIGGGIGGLAAALSLLRASIDVCVYERVGAHSDVGACIQVSPKATRMLHRLGLPDALASMGVRPLAWHQRRWDDGRILLRTPVTGVVEAAFRFPHYLLHRADLLNTLSRAMAAERLHIGHRVTTLVDHRNYVEAQRKSGTRVSVDALVGADDIQASVCEVLFGPDKPYFTGCVAYRGRVPSDRLAQLGLEVTTQIWTGRRCVPRDAALHGPGRWAGDRGWRCAGMRRCACHGPRAFRRCRPPIRRASACPTGRRSRRAMQRWLAARPIGHCRR